MIKKTYESVYFMPNEPTSIIKTGKFQHQPSRNHFLTDVVVEEHDNFHRIYGKKRTFEWHQHDCDFAYDFVERGMVKDYCIYDEDWFMSRPGFIARLFGSKPEKCLKSNWYMHKTKMKDVVFTVYGGLIEEHY